MNKTTLKTMLVAATGTWLTTACFTDYADDADLKVMINYAAPEGDTEQAKKIQELQTEADKLDADLRKYYESEKYNVKDELPVIPVDLIATLTDGSKLGFIDPEYESGTLWAMTNIGSNAPTGTYSKTIDDFLSPEFKDKDGSLKMPEKPFFTGSSQEKIEEIVTIGLADLDKSMLEVQKPKTLEAIEEQMQEYREACYACDHEIFQANERRRVDYRKWVNSNYTGDNNGYTYVWGNASPASVEPNVKATLPTVLGPDEDPVTKLLGPDYSTPSPEQFEELALSAGNYASDDGFWGIRLYNTFSANKHELPLTILETATENGTDGIYYMTNRLTGNTDAEGNPTIYAYHLNIKTWLERVEMPVTSQQRFFLRAVKNKK